MKQRTTHVVRVDNNDGEMRVNEITREMVAEDLVQMRETIDHVWAHAEDKRNSLGMDVQALYDRARNELSRAKDLPAMYRSLHVFVAGLEDGHSHLRPSPVMLSSISRLPDPDKFPGLREVREGIVVEEQPENERRIRKGDLLLRLNGQDVEEVIAVVSRHLPASGTAAKRQFAIRHMLGASAILNQDAAMELQRPDGTTYVVALSTSAANDLSKWQGVMKFAPGARKVLRLEDGIGYLRIPSFTLHADWWKNDQTEMSYDKALTSDRFLECWQAAVQWFDATFRELIGTQALVIDLRGNGGGNDPIASYLAQYLIPGDFMYYALQRKFSPEWKAICPSMPAEGWGPRVENWVRADRPFKFDPNAALFPRNTAIKPFSGPVVVLIDADCASATTVFLTCLRHYRPDLRLVGRPAVSTIGGGNPIVTLKNTQAVLGLSYCRGWNAAGELLEGLVVNPDITVTWTRQNVLANADPDLESARNVIWDRLTTGNPWSRSGGTGK